MRRLIILFTLIFLVVLALDLYPGLRGGSGWQWAYAEPENWAGVIALGVCLVVYLFGVYLLRRYADSVVWLNLLWSFLGAGIIGIAVVGVQGNAGFTLFTRTVSPVQTGASTVAVQIMARDGLQSTLENWLSVMRSAEDANIIHFSTSPPGQAVFHYSLAQFFDRVPLNEQLSMALRPYQCSNPDIMRYTRGEIMSAGLGLLMPFFAGLTVIPLYVVARYLTINPSTSLHLTHWWALIPTVLLFAPTWNTVYPFLTLSAFALLFTGLRSQQGFKFALFCVLAGVVMSITTSLNFAVLPIVLFLGLFTLGYAFLVNPNDNPTPKYWRGESAEGITHSAMDDGESLEIDTASDDGDSPSLSTGVGSGGGVRFADNLPPFSQRSVREKGTGDEGASPDFDSMSPEELMSWMEGLASPSPFTGRGSGGGVRLFLIQLLSRLRSGGGVKLLFAIRAGLYFGLGLSSIWLIFFLTSGLTPLDIWRVTAEAHAELVQRDYLTWLILHPYDVLLFVGWCVAGMFAWAVWKATRETRSTRRVTSAHILVFSMLITLVLVDMSGMVQGENARILSFYAPFLLLSGLVLFKPKPHWWELSLLATQAVTVLVMASVLSVVPLDLNPMPSAPREDLPTFDFLELLPVEATFISEDYAGSFELEAHRFIADLAQQTITLEIHWRGISRTERPYQFQMIATAENSIDGHIESEPFIWYPQSGNYLTTCWREDDLIRDVITIPLPAISEPVVWALTLTAIDERTGDIAGLATLGPVNYP